MTNGFQSNETFNQIEHKKLTSLVKMTTILQSNGTSYAYHMPISYLSLAILQFTYLPTHPPTQMYYLPTFPQTYLHTCVMYLHTHPPTHLPTYLHTTYPPTYLSIYLLTHPPTYSYNLPSYLPTFIRHNLIVKCQNKHVE